MSARIWLRNQRTDVQDPPCEQDEVARVAYQLYEERSREDGHDLEDWLKAEAIVKQRADRCAARAADGQAVQRK